MGRKTPPFPEYEAWTQAKFFAFLRSGLREKWSRWPPKYQILKAAERPYKGPDKRRKKEYQCSQCNKWHAQKNISVDHIIPAGTLKEFCDLPGFAQRLFVGADKLRVLCNPCHAKVTATQRKENQDRQATDS